MVKCVIQPPHPVERLAWPPHLSHAEGQAALASNVAMALPQGGGGLGKWAEGKAWDGGGGGSEGALVGARRRRSALWVSALAPSVVPPSILGSDNRQDTKVVRGLFQICSPPSFSLYNISELINVTFSLRPGEQQAAREREGERERAEVTRAFDVVLVQLFQHADQAESRNLGALATVTF